MHNNLRFILTVSLIAVSGMCYARLKRRGWHIINSTPSPIAVAWYDTKIQLIKTSRSLRHPLFPAALKKAIGSKSRLTQPCIIESNERFFLEAIESTDYQQLLITQSPALLRDTLSTDDQGKLEIDGIFAYDDQSHRILGDPSLEHVPRRPQLYVRQYLGTPELVLNESVDELSGDTLIDKGWYLKNRSQQRIYCGWYTSRWDEHKKDFIEPTLDVDQYIIALEPGQQIPLPFREKPYDPKLFKRQLLFACTYDELQRTVDLETDMTLFAQTAEELGSSGTTWHVFQEEGVPYLVPHTNLIQVINTTQKNLYCALYHVEKSGAVKCGPQDLVVELKPHLRGELHFPDGKWGSDICLFVAQKEYKGLLKKRALSPHQLKPLFIKSFSKTGLVNWYTHRQFSIEPNLFDPQKIHITSLGSGLLEHIARKAFDIGALEKKQSDLFEERFLAQDPLYTPDQDIMLAKGTPSVITDPQEKDREIQFLKKRSEHVRKAINNLLGIDTIKEGDPVPTIALVFTGGGYRAMIETIGFLQGAADENEEENQLKGSILDCCTYMMGLSGSTWAINPLVISGLTPDDFAQRMRQRVGYGGFIPINTLISKLIEESPTYPEIRFIQKRYGQFHGPVGLYGHALVHALLDGTSLNGKHTQAITLSDLRTRLTEGEYPLPISVAIDPGQHDTNRIWYEFNPYYIGTQQEGGSWIDSKLFGSIFYDSKPVHCVPEYPLGQLMGIWGSAFALSTQDIAKESTVGGFIAKAIAGLSSGLETAYNLIRWKSCSDRLSSARTTAGTIPNFTYRRSNSSEKLSEKPLLHLIDGGIAKDKDYRHNFAAIPALWRDVDILIMCDCTGTPNDDEEAIHLCAVDEEARRQNLAFPSITTNGSLKNMHNEVASLITQDSAPLVVYIKAKKNEQYNKEIAQKYRYGFDPDVSVARFTQVSNFSYTPEQFDLLSGLTKSIMIQSKDLIKQAITTALARQ